MSSWYVMTALGLFVAAPGNPHGEYVVGTPFFSHVQITYESPLTDQEATQKVSKSRILHIVAPRHAESASLDSPHVQAVYLNGRRVRSVGHGPAAVVPETPGRSPNTLSHHELFDGFLDEDAQILQFVMEGEENGPLLRMGVRGKQAASVADGAAVPMTTTDPAVLQELEQLTESNAQQQSLIHQLRGQLSALRKASPLPPLPNLNETVPHGLPPWLTHTLSTSPLLVVMVVWIAGSATLLAVGIAVILWMYLWFMDYFCESQFSEDESEEEGEKQSTKDLTPPSRGWMPMWAQQILHRTYPELWAPTRVISSNHAAPNTTHTPSKHKKKAVYTV